MWRISVSICDNIRSKAFQTLPNRKFILLRSNVSRDFARFQVFTVGTLIENLFVSVVVFFASRSKTVKKKHKFSSFLWSLTI